MKLSEVFNTRLDLFWQQDADLYHTKFKIDDRTYGISVREEIIQNFNFIRIDFHFEDETGSIHHEATGLNKDAGKILSIIVNGIKEKFSTVDGYWFIAKKRTGENEFESRVKLYSRIAGKMCVENNLRELRYTAPGENAFVLCKSKNAEDAIKDIFQDDLP